jgi:hypothetical protein
MPPNPCFKCVSEGNCVTAGLVCRLAIEAWVDDRLAEIPPCPFKEEAFYHGIEGVYA